MKSPIAKVEMGEISCKLPFCFVFLDSCRMWEHSQIFSFLLHEIWEDEVLFFHVHFMVCDFQGQCV